MPHHCEDDGGYETSSRHQPERMIVVGSSPMALDTGDADEFTFTREDDFACIPGFRTHRRGKVVVAA